MESTKWTENSLTVAIKHRFPPPAYIFLPQVANGTGDVRCRTADALVMSVWPSRGLDLIGFEIKVSRSDWLQELKRPEKAETIARYCNKWYLVAASEVLVKPGELPSAWGLMLPKGRGLRIAKEAALLEAKPISRAFLAALLRNAANAIVAKAEISEELERARSEGKRAGEQQGKWKFERLERELAQLRTSVGRFEQVSGLTIDGYNGERLGRAVALVKSQGVERITSELRELRNSAQEIVSTIDRGLHDFEQASGR